MEPREAYESRLADRYADVARLRRLDARLSLTRGVVFFAGGLLWWLAVGPELVAPVWVFSAIGLFIALALGHEGVAAALRRRGLAARYVERALARLRGEKDGALDDGERFRDPAHPYTDDLDVFGSGSLYARLCLARTGEGRARLADWLRGPATPEALAERSSAVSELADRLDLREELWLLGEDVAAGIRPEGLRRWCAAEPTHFASWEQPAALLVSLLVTLSLVSWLGFGGAADPVILAIVVWSALYVRVRGRADSVLARVEQPAAEVALLARVLARLYREPFGTPRLRELHARLEAEGEPASAAVARLRRLVDLLESRRNALFAPFAALGFLELHGAARVEAWRRQHASALPRWLDAVAEFEALLSLAGWAYDHPEQPFAEMRAEQRGFEAESLGHPLLPPGSCVRNDVRIDDAQRLLVVSGSNMSGKSTLLRAIGANLVLAQAGAPVRARRLRLGPLQLGASIRVGDSLLEGRSRFYAEISRLRQVLDLSAGPVATLFLLDELLAGTNSEDRRVGAESVVRALLERGALGLLTTHDLALTRLPEVLGAIAGNAHFEDQVEGDRVVFDYRLRPGVVKRGNALALMRAIGLVN